MQDGGYRSIMFDAVCVAVLIAYFLHFGLPALRGLSRGRDDEHGNLLESRRTQTPLRERRLLEGILCFGRRSLRSASLPLSPCRRFVLSAALSLL